MDSASPQWGRGAPRVGLSVLLALSVSGAAGPVAAQAPSRGKASPASAQASAREGSSPAEAQLGAADRRDGETYRVMSAKIEAQGPQGGQVVVTADRPFPPIEEHFKLHEPPRVVINIPGALDAWRGNTPGSAEGPIKAVRSAQYKERPVPVVRVVVDLRSDLPYRVDVAGNQLRVSIGGAEIGRAHV